MINRLLAEVVKKLDYEPLDFSGSGEENPTVLTFLEDMLSMRFGLRNKEANFNYRLIRKLFDSSFNDIPVTGGITTLNIRDTNGNIDAIMLESAPHYDDVRPFMQEEATAYLLVNGIIAFYYKPKDTMNGIVNAANLKVDGVIMPLDRFQVKTEILSDLKRYGLATRPLEKIDPLVNLLAMLSEAYRNSGIHREMAATMTN